MWRLACVLIGYLCGCVLFAEVAAHIFAGTSIFEVGNGNPGMANTARSVSPVAAALCLAGDVGKVALAAVVGHLLFPQQPFALVAGWAGIGATLGHDFPFWHGFKGGKGVATISATLFLLDWRAALVATVVAALSVVISGYLSIAAVVAAGAFVIALLFMSPGELVAIAVVLFALATVGQWTNLWGIRDGSAQRDVSRR